MTMQKYVYKVALVGSTHVGKTTLQQRVVKGKFFEHLERTVGVTFEAKSFIKDNKQIILQIWDFGGQLQYERIAELLISGSKAVFYVFDLTRPTTLVELDNIWIPLGKKLGSPDGIYVLVGNKADLPKRVLSEQIKKVALKYNLPYYETSAKTGQGLSELFDYVINKLITIKASRVFEAKF